MSRKDGKPQQVSSHMMDNLSPGGHPCRWASFSDHNPDEMCFFSQVSTDTPALTHGGVSGVCLSFGGALFVCFFLNTMQLKRLAVSDSLKFLVQ